MSKAVKDSTEHDHKLIDKVFFKHCVYRSGSDYIDIIMAMQDYAERYAKQLKKGGAAQ